MAAREPVEAITRDLDLALSLFKPDTQNPESCSYYRSGALTDLVSSFPTDATAEAGFVRLHDACQHLRADLNNIFTLCFRLVWLQGLRTAGQLDDWLWMQFAKSDVDMFHVEVRSLFDHAAEALATVANKPKQVPRSFHDLREWVKREANAQHRLGADLAVVVTGCDWFDELRTVRDQLVHCGGETLVFLPKDRILFQVRAGRTWPFIVHPHLMFNENVVDFERYVGLYVGRLLAFLDRFATAVWARANVRSVGFDGRSYHPGHEQVMKWIGAVRDTLRAVPPGSD